MSTNNGEVIVTYTPPPDYIGSDSFTYTNTDYRNHKPCCDDRFNLLAAGLWNLRLAFKTT